MGMLKLTDCSSLSTTKLNLLSTTKLKRIDPKMKNEKYW